MGSPYLPESCTQAMHDAAHQSYTADESNAIQREVESRAEEEVRTAAPAFVDWLADYATAEELARLLGYYKTDNRAECRVILDDITARYQQYRVATLDAAEESEIREGM